MKTFLPSASFRTAAVAFCCLIFPLFSFNAKAQDPTVYYAGGDLCEGSDVHFYFDDWYGGSVSYWEVWGYDYTIVYQTSNSIMVRWNTAQSYIGVAAYYNSYNYPYNGTAYSPYYTISVSQTPMVSLNHTNPYINPGQTLAFQASPTNGGASPYYYWYVNGAYVADGTSGTYNFSQSATGSYTLTCYLYSSEPCATSSAVASTTVTVVEPLAAPYAFGNVLMATLPGSNITVSSSSLGAGLWRGLLFDQSGPTWEAQTNNQNQYLQADLGEVRQVEGIITQGNYNNGQKWVTGYTLSYSTDGTTWVNYSQAFTANTDTQTPAARTVSSPFAARFVRIRPTGWNGHISMRAEIVSVPFGRSSVTFAASQPAGANTNRWYTTATGGAPVHTGTSFTTSLPEDKTWYVSSYNTANGVESATRTAVTGKVKFLENMNHLVVNTINVRGIKSAQEVYTLPVENDRRQEVAYLDRLGRPLQQVVARGSFNKNDIVAFTAYDALNREAVKYLPYTAGNDSKYKTNALSAQPSFYQAAKADNKALAESRFESSPLGRVIEQSAPGTPWQLAATPEEGKTNKIAYSKNGPGEIRIWNYNLATKTATGTTYYPANALSVTQTTDVHGMKSIEYKDKRGQVVCRKVQKVLNENNYLWSYNVYDDLGNLQFVIPPEAVNQLSAVNYTFTYNDPFCRRWLFAYQYDARWRITEKSVPGGGVTFMVYDPSDRAILTQDEAEYAGKQWRFVKYDALGREIMAGRYTHSAQVPQDQMQQAVDAYYAANASLKNYESRSNASYAAYHGYTNQAFPVMPSPNSAGGQPDIVSYYDDYDFDYNGVPGETAKGEPAYVNLGGSFETAPGRTKGKPTGTRTRVLGTNTWLLSAAFYDAEGQVVQTQLENYNTTGIVPAGTGRTLEVTGTSYDFAGKVLRTEQRHCLAVTGNTSNLTIKQRYVYDHAGMLKEQYQQVNNEAEQKLAGYTYNEVGEMTGKVVGNGSGLQTMDYSYNMQGWLKSINNGVLAGTDIFAMSFKHNESGTSPQYNGNIAALDWISKTDNVLRTYNFGYDGLNRMLSGTYSATAAEEQFSVNNITYDDNGNLKSLHRQNLLQRKPNEADLFGYVDKLAYAHDGNRLTAVEDELHATTTQARDFPDKSRTTVNATEYFYDASGRLSEDKNKGITSIIYNELGLPAVIYLGSSDYLTNVYDATGAKLQTTVTKAGSVASTQKYVGGVVYRNDVPQFIATSEGRMLSPQVTGASAWVYEYHYRDHLGSLRVAFRQSQNVSFTAGMETASDPAWSNTGSPVRNSERASSGSYSAKLTTDNPLGPWKTVKVNKGDMITVSAWGTYTQAPSNNSAVNLVPYVNALPAQTTESGNIPARLSLGLAVVPLATNNSQSAVPKAYLQYILQTADGAVTRSERQYLTTLANGTWESHSMSYMAQTEVTCRYW